MREDYKPGDMSVQLAFGRIFGGPDQGQIKPHLSVTDQTSGRSITINLTAEDLAEMLAGGTANIPADRIIGYKSTKVWGKYPKIKKLTVKTQGDDYKLRDGDLGTKAPLLPHIAPAIAQLVADGFVPDAPRRNNSGEWVLVGRRYDDNP